MPRAKLIAWLAAAMLYAIATINTIQFYVLSNRAYLKTDRYFAGTERLPFQERVFPIPFLKLFAHLPAAIPFLRSGGGVFNTANFGDFFLSLISFSIASVSVVMLYRSASRTRALSGLVAPLFLALTVATYVVRPTARFFFPYDMPSLAFFSAGMVCIYKRQFVPLFLIVLVGTFNRETTLFLIVIFVLDAVVTERAWPWRWRQVPWIKTMALTAAWLVVHLSLVHAFAGNDRSESYNRLRENLHRFRPSLLPSILNVCGYVLPVVFLRRKHLGNQRLAAWLLVVPAWIALMMFVGVITESRIYGELVPLTAVAATLMLEEHADRVSRNDRADGDAYSPVQP